MRALRRPARRSILWSRQLPRSVLSLAIPNPHLWAYPYVTSTNLPHSILWTNLWLGLFNLLPAYPMDGGRVLRAIFSRTMDPVRATRRAISLGKGFCAGVSAWPACGAWARTTRLGDAGWFLMIGVFLLLAAQTEERSAVFHSVLETVHLEDIMLTDFAILSPADTLEDALEKAVHCLQDDFPVIRSGDMVGVVSKQKMLQTLRSDGNGYVQSVMSRMFDVAPRSDTLASAFRKLSARNLEHSAGGRRPATGGNCYLAEPDALHGAACRRPGNCAR